MNLEFNWKFNNYEIHACPKRLVRFYDEEPNKTIDFIKKYEDDDGTTSCFSIAYFKQNSDGYWNLNIVGNRFWDEVPEEDWMLVLRALKMAHKTLNECCGKED